MSLNFYCEDNECIREESVNVYKNLFSDYENNPPSLEEALYQMFTSSNLDDKTSKKFTKNILNNCKIDIDKKFTEIKKKYQNITKEDAYIICSYTCESEDRNYSPYRLLNQNLVKDNTQNGIRNISKYLYILLKALRKLPRYYPKEKKYLYRCIAYKVCLKKDPNNKKLVPYANGNKKTFWGFTSTSSDSKLTLSFLNKEGNMSSGTIFILGGDIWGYDIELFNYFHEKEILLEPERKFIVDNVMPEVNKVININCSIIKSPLILTNNESDLNDDNNYEKSWKIYDSSINLIKYTFIKLDIEANICGEKKYKSGLGILCNIPLKNIKALITYNHVINLDFLNNGKIMTLHINNEEKKINLKMNRYKYTNESLDFTIIEILEKDYITKFIEIDEFIFSKSYEDENCLTYSLNKNRNIKVFKSLIKEENSDNYICNITSIKEGITTLKDECKLIGLINNNKKEKKNFIHMKMIIDKINYIKCKYNVKIKDNKEIQIINNKDNDKDCLLNYINNEIPKEIKIIINGEINSNILTYRLNKEGIYTIYIMTYNLLNNMSYMFNNCSLLEEIDLSSFNTKRVRDMSYMFNNCTLLKKINFSSFNTNEVTNMDSMFKNCKSLKKLDLSSFNTHKVTNMASMFKDCDSLEELKISFETNQVTNMEYMFYRCTYLPELNLTSFNTKKVTNMSHMFSRCDSLKELNISTFETNEKTDISKMFESDHKNKRCEFECNDERIKRKFKGCICSCLIL